MASVAVIFSLFIIKPRKKDWTHHEAKPQNDVSNELFMTCCVFSNFEKSEIPYKQRIITSLASNKVLRNTEIFDFVLFREVLTCKPRP